MRDSRVKHAGLILAAVIGAPLLLFGLFRNHIPLSFYTVASASMEPTLREGSMVLSNGPKANCGTIKPRPGDVVVHAVEGGLTRLHRVVAGGGQTVQMRGGALFIDGKPVTARRGQPREGEFGRTVIPVRETLANGAAYETQDFGPDGFLDNTAPIRVPAGHWFVMGDNRDNSIDSRVDGPVDGRAICGVVTRIITGPGEGGKP